MADLKHKIYHLEKQIIRNKYALRNDYEHLVQELKQPKVVLIGLAASFVLGIIASRPKHRHRLMRISVKIPSYLQTATRHLATVLRFIPL